jgi:hypothetical protein
MAERIVDKYWIDPSGALHHVTDEHQLYAWTFLGPKVTKKFTKGKWQADDEFLKRGWIRVQIYSEDGLALQGQREYLNRNGQFILEAIPSPRRVYINVWPTGEYKYYGAEELDKIGWDALAKKSKGKTLFAALLREIATDVKPGDKLTLQEQWARRARP